MLNIFTFTHLSLLCVVFSYKVNIKTKQGVIVGRRETTVFNEKTYYAFYGVPYAKPPIGRLRFKNPVRARRWEDPYDATVEYHGACAQAHIVHTDSLYGSEDCLYMNIYTPVLQNREKSNLKSIIIWIHGYAFSNSFSHIHGPDFLIENDVIVITMTHRLGAFGFIKLNQNDSNANMGLKDIAMGLRWIHNNVEFFGGNTNKITVMGSGSACAYLSLLLATKYHKLFSKMILHSGSIFSPSLFQGNKTYEKLKLKMELKSKGIKSILKASTKEIISASRNVYTNNDILNIQRPLVPFLPIRETRSNQSLLTKGQAQIYRDITNKSLNKTILLGHTSQESISELIPFIHNPSYLDAFKKSFRFMVPFSDGCKYQFTSKKYRIVAAKIEDYYFNNRPPGDYLSNFLKLTSDLYKYPIFKFIKELFSTGKDKIFVYNFNYVGKLNVVKATSIVNTDIKIKGAAQGDELCYIFKCEPLWETYVKLKAVPNDVDVNFIKVISQTWADFAKFSNANSVKNGNINWLPMTSTQDHIFYLSKVNKIIDSKKEQKMFEFWNELYANFFSNNNCNQIRNEL